MNLRTPKKYRHDWAFMETRIIAPNDEHGPMMKRHRLIRVPWFGIFIHEIFRPDVDRDVHDHPWAFWSLVLKGQYKEEVIHIRCTNGLETKVHRRFSLHKMPLHKAHYISDILGPLVTLVVVGRRQKESWGFYSSQPDEGFIHWRDYISKEGKLGPDPFDADLPF